MHLMSNLIINNSSSRGFDTRRSSIPAVVVGERSFYSGLGMLNGRSSGSVLTILNRSLSLWTWIGKVRLGTMNRNCSSIGSLKFRSGMNGSLHWNKREASDVVLWLVWGVRGVT